MRAELRFNLGAVKYGNRRDGSLYTAWLCFKLCYLSDGKIESGLLETINDESIPQDSASVFNSIKQKLLKKAEKNLGHYSIQD